MSQTENAVTSHQAPSVHTGKVTLFRPERGKELLARRSNTHKAFHAVIQARLKDRLE